MKYISLPSFASFLVLLALFSFIQCTTTPPVAEKPPVSTEDFTRINYQNPELATDLGVGLWAWPLPMDFDEDGDMDLYG